MPGCGADGLPRGYAHAEAVASVSIRATEPARFREASSSSVGSAGADALTTSPWGRSGTTPARPTQVAPRADEEEGNDAMPPLRSRDVGPRPSRHAGPRRRRRDGTLARRARWRQPPGHRMQAARGRGLYPRPSRQRPTARRTDGPSADQGRLSDLAVHPRCNEHRRRKRFRRRNAFAFVRSGPGAQTAG